MGRAIILPAIVFLFYGISFVPSGGEAFVLDMCHCWNDMNETLKEELVKFDDPPRAPLYKYTGVKPRAGNYFFPCLCTDVTRIETSLIVSNEALFTEIGNSTDMQFDNLTLAITNIFAAVDEEGLVIDFRTTFESVETSPNSIWKIEIWLRGIDLTVNSQVTEMFRNQTEQDGGTYMMTNVGTIENSSLEFQVVECPGDPIIPSQNGQRTWTDNLRLPGSRAVYTCDDGYFVADPDLAYSECSHTNITWLEPELNITCKKGCQENPTSGPYFSIRNWKTSLREDSDEAIYTCMDGYRSQDGTNGSSICDGRSAEWSVLAEDFRCEQILCPIDIPQVPAFAETDWDNIRFIGTEIQYNCIENYSPTVKGSLRIKCTRNGDWTRYPRGFRCIDIDLAVKLGYFDDSLNSYDYYNDGIERSTTASISYFAAVTIPCVIGIGSIVMLCLCCTRINSWLYVMCTGNTKNTSYVAV